MERLERLKEINNDIWKYSSGGNGNHRIPWFQRKLTDDEWKTVVEEFTDNNNLIFGITSQFGFTPCLLVSEIGPYPGTSAEPVISLDQEHIPDEVLGEASWEAAWDLFSKWVFAKENIDRYKVLGWVPPNPNPGHYTY